MSVTSVAAQEMEADSTWDIMDLDPEEFEFEADDLDIELSSGWFPNPKSGFNTLSLSFHFGSNYDYAVNIRPSGFKPTFYPFHSDNPLTDNEAKLMEPFSNKESDDDPPGTGCFQAGFDYHFSSFLPFIIGVKSSIAFPGGILFTSDWTKSFLNHEGKKQNFKEVGVMYLDEIIINLGLELNLPLYGAFWVVSKEKTASYYYLSAGVSASYPIYSSATQYVQIANAKDELRFDNGRDTINLMTDERIKGLNDIRYHLDFALGWELFVMDFGFRMELYYSYPLNSVLKDAKWLQHRGGYKFSLFIDEIF